MIKLIVFVAIMFGFAFAMVPFYNIACKALGISQAKELLSETTADATHVNSDRLVDVEFDVTLNQLPIIVKPQVRKLSVHPGEHMNTVFYATNTSKKPIVLQAVPSITPGNAASHFKKIECFCFTRQRLEAGEKKAMPLVFYIDSEFPEKVKLMTLSYAFFEIPTAPIN